MWHGVVAFQHFRLVKNASRLTRQLQKQTLLTHKILSSIFPSSCDIFVTVVGLFAAWGHDHIIYLGVGNSRVAEVQRRSGMSCSRDDTLNGREGILSGEHSQNQRNLACGHNSTHNTVVLPGSQTVDYPLEEHRTRKTSMRLPAMFGFYL